MAATIIMLMKKSSNINDFSNAINNYLKTQGFILIDNVVDLNRIYFYKDNIPPTTLRGVISTIKNTKYYSTVVTDLYYTSNLTKA